MNAKNYNHEAVEAMADALADILHYSGGADSVLDDPYVMERADEALAAYRGEAATPAGGGDLPELPEGWSALDWGSWLRDRGSSFDPYVQGPLFAKLAIYIESLPTRLASTGSAPAPSAVTTFKVGDAGKRRDGSGYVVTAIDHGDTVFPVNAPRAGGQHWYTADGRSCTDNTNFDLLPPTHNIYAPQEQQA